MSNKHRDFNRKVKVWQHNMKFCISILSKFFSGNIQNHGRLLDARVQAKIRSHLNIENCFYLATWHRLKKDEQESEDGESKKVEVKTFSVRESLYSPDKQ